MLPAQAVVPAERNSLCSGSPRLISKFGFWQTIVEDEHPKEGVGSSFTL